jgi:hypothetical protein
MVWNLTPLEYPIVEWLIWIGLVMVGVIMGFTTRRSASGMVAIAVNKLVSTMIGLGLAASLGMNACSPASTFKGGKRLHPRTTWDNEREARLSSCLYARLHNMIDIIKRNKKMWIQVTQIPEKEEPFTWLYVEKSRGLLFHEPTRVGALWVG